MHQPLCNEVCHLSCCADLFSASVVYAWTHALNVLGTSPGKQLLQLFSFGSPLVKLLVRPDRSIVIVIVIGGGGGGAGGGGHPPAPYPPLLRARRVTPSIPLIVYNMQTVSAIGRQGPHPAGVAVLWVAFPRSDGLQRAGFPPPGPRRRSEEAARCGWWRGSPPPLAMSGRSVLTFAAR